MKFINVNTDDDTIWRKSLKQYESYLETIKSRFPKKFYSFFTEKDLHDYMLIEFKIVKRYLSNRTCIDIKTLWRKHNKQICLIFKDVKEIKTNIDLTNGYCEFGDYIIGEFLEVDENFLSFEFLFYNESTFYIVFKKLQFNTGTVNQGTGLGVNQGTVL